MRQEIRHDRARRLLIKTLLAALVASVTPWRMRAIAAVDSSQWPKDAFTQKSEADAIKTLFGTSDTEVSDQVKLDAPEIAENGAVVPITVSSALPGVTSIAILVAENPFPLAATYRIPPGTTGMVSNRLKMAKTSKVVALVEANGKIYSASKE